MNPMNPKADFYFLKAGRWQEETLALRQILLSCGLDEAVKWGVPCYTFQGRNIVLMHVFKEYCAVLFFKGALLHDAEGLLVQQTENTQASRQIRFTRLPEVAEREAFLKAYVYEAIEVEKAGLQVAFKKTEEFALPEEFQRTLAENPALKAAFEALTPGRQRGYALHFAAPKQAKTRQARIEKCLERIFNGEGLND